MITYIVKTGDNLTKIAKRYSVPLNAVIAVNPQISDPNLIYPGQAVKIPFDDPRPSVPIVLPKESPSILDKRFIKGYHGRYHVETPAFEAGQDGTLGNHLSEPVPKYFARAGDGVLRANGFTEGASDNNTMIIMGRDRTGLGEIDSARSSQLLDTSGYSSYMGAGAIDIVVGRCSPFPLDVEGKTWGPMFNTIKNIPELEIETLDGLDPENGGRPFFTNHPAYAMDAARIYISQMTDIY